MIELIKDLNQLQGTCYFEFLPGNFNKKCWNEESVFIYYLHICYIESILERYILNYDHYSFMFGSKYDWLNIINELDRMNETLRKANDLNEFTSKLDFVFLDIEENFIKDFDKSKVELVKMTDDFVLWIRETLKSHNNIAILGM